MADLTVSKVLEEMLDSPWERKEDSRYYPDEGATSSFQVDTSWEDCQSAF